ncbi:type IV pilus assembly protein PilM [Dongshaea marina]|uniref:type IV pilus assembly protein PilM n=1 Tax=Dongshaea marina TaxID=2047966 RepID=UPI001900B368|nr:type IV pilus assembly protein PilM [Dongshaea marina]
MASLFQSSRLIPMVGVDFGSQSIKALVVAGRSGQLTIESCVELPTPKGSMVEQQLQDIEKMATVLRQLKKNLPAHYHVAATAVSGTGVISKIIQMDGSLSDLELETQLEVEAEQIIPFPRDEISLDFEVIGANEVDPTKNDLLLSAARTESITAQVSALSEIGLDTKVVDVSTHALGRAVLETVPELASSQEVIGIIDLGLNTMGFSVMVKGQVIYTRLQNFGGEAYTQGIANFYNFTPEEAEQAKLNNNLPANFDVDVFAPYMTNLIQQVRRNIQLFCSSGSYREVNQLVLTGGGSLVPSLPSQLATELELEVLHPDPFAHCSWGRKVNKDPFKAMGPKFMTALGLALRSFVPCQL